MRVRGLKLLIPKEVHERIHVAPRAGAWIETQSVVKSTLRYRVAPRAGAWIETVCKRHVQNCIKSHPVRVRGLKPAYSIPTLGEPKSHPVRVRGLKPL